MSLSPIFFSDSERFEDDLLACFPVGEAIVGDHRAEHQKAADDQDDAARHLYPKSGRTILPPPKFNTLPKGMRTAPTHPTAVSSLSCGYLGGFTIAHPFRKLYASCAHPFRLHGQLFEVGGDRMLF